MNDIILTDYEDSDYELVLDSIDVGEYPELDEEFQMLNKVGEVEFYCGDLDETLTIKEWLKALLLKLWVSEEGFSGKRPFGNSGWKFNVVVPLMQAGLLKGTYEIDEDGWVQDCDYDEEEFNQLVINLIREL